MKLKNVYERYLGELVNIGIPNYQKKYRLFYLTGLVIGNEENFITLKIKDRIRKIPYDDIIDISINEEEEV